MLLFEEFVVTIMSVIDESIKISIARLPQHADDCSKRVLTAFDPSAKRSANIKAISSFNLDILDMSHLPLS